MSDPLRTLEDYELFLYTLPERFKSIRHSTVTLASTHPHHKHILPDIRNHRVPAPEMSFTRPNLPSLIAEVEELFAAAAG
jgi:hypothetical protein